MLNRKEAVVPPIINHQNSTTTMNGTTARKAVEPEKEERTLIPIEKTKKCLGCGRTLPLTEFSRHWRSKDGYMEECKECRRRRTSAATSSNPLEKFTARQLMLELKTRGYKGTLEYVEVHHINLSTI